MFTENIVSPIFAATDSDGDSVTVYMVVWPNGRVTYTIESTNGCDTNLVQITARQASALSEALGNV